jgi:hypothetical protein
MDPAKPWPNESPIACNVEAFSPAQRECLGTLGGRWRTGVQESRELPDGYALRLQSDASAVMAAAEWMTLDRLCCPFLTYTLEIEREGGPVWLHLTGRPGVKEFIRRAMIRDDG